MAGDIAPAVQWMVRQAIPCGIHEAGHKLAQRPAKQSDSSNPFQEIEDMILRADKVSIGFSAWSEDALNLGTTCDSVGIPNGYIEFGGSVGVEKLLCDTLERQKVVVHLYQWCLARAPEADVSQRSFRFKKGHYVGKGRFISTTAAIVGVKLVGFLTGAGGG